MPISSMTSFLDKNNHASLAAITISVLEVKCWYHHPYLLYLMHGYYLHREIFNKTDLTMVFLMPYTYCGRVLAGVVILIHTSV